MSSPKIKICGLTRAEDAALAAQLGAWALGFIFHARSPRAVDAATAGRIVRGLGSAPVPVGVFVDASQDEIVQTVEQVGLGKVQLHGSEDPAYCGELARRLPRIGLIKALRPQGLADLDSIPKYAASCEAILLDTYVAGTPGGTGLTGDWSLAERASKRAKIILAGGLGPDNVRAALRVPGVFAVDASSGLEEAPGRKSSEKLRSFFKNASEVGS